MVEVVQVDFKHIDERGKLIQLVHEGYSQINVLESKKGIIRGGHYHKKHIEAFYVISGEVELTIKESLKIYKTVFREGDFFRILPNTTHSMFFTKDCIMVQMYDSPVEDENGQKDIIPDEI